MPAIFTRFEIFHIVFTLCIVECDIGIHILELSYFAMILKSDRSLTRYFAPFTLCHLNNNAIS